MQPGGRNSQAHWAFISKSLCQMLDILGSFSGGIHLNVSATTTRFDKRISLLLIVTLDQCAQQEKSLVTGDVRFPTAL